MVDHVLDELGGPDGEVALAADQGAVHQLVVDHLDALVAGDLEMCIRDRRTADIFDDLARLFSDPKPTTARQCVQAAPALAQAQPSLAPRIAEALESVDPGRYPDSTAPLVAADVAAALEAVRALGSTAT